MENARQDTLNFEAPLSLEICRTKLQWLKHDLKGGGRIEVDLMRANPEAWQFTIWHIPKGRTPESSGVMQIQGIITRHGEESTHVMGKLYAEFILLDAVTPIQLALLISLLIILYFVLPGLGVGAIGLLLAVGFMIWQYVDYQMRRKAMLRLITDALHPKEIG